MEIVHLVLCAYMTGLCWFVQRVHYPSFKALTPDQGKNHAIHHTEPTKWITAPPMVLELVTAFYLVYYSPNLFWSVNLASVILIWLSTFLIQVPAHNRLLKTWNLKTINFLVQSNWIRTILWTLRTIILLYFIAYE